MRRLPEPPPPMLTNIPRHSTADRAPRQPDRMTPQTQPWKSIFGSKKTARTSLREPWINPRGSRSNSSIAASALGSDARTVQAVLFDKTAARNWALGWHQDHTILVEHHADIDGFDPWTIKAGLNQVEPPFAILERMVTTPVHLDPVDTTNAPLRIVPGSHRLGRLREASIEHIVEDRGEPLCLANRGDVCFYATTGAANPPHRRRVLQIDYAVIDLPKPVRWHGL